MCIADQELQRIRILPGVEALIQNLTDQFNAIGDTVRDSALEKYAAMKSEYANYLRVVTGVKKEAEKKSIEAVEGYMKKYKKLVRDSEYKSRDELESSIGLFRSDLMELKSILMLTEVDLVEIVRKLNDEFETRYTSLVSQYKECFQTFFRAVENNLNEFGMEVGNTVFNLYDEFNKDDVSEEKLNTLDDDMKSV